MFDQPTSKRQYWTFTFSVREVLKAVDSKVGYHEGKVDQYRKMAEEAEAELRERGVKFQETPNLSNSYSTQQRINIVVDPQKQQALETAQAKEREHRAKLYEYEKYQSALRTMKSDDTLELTVDDLEFFDL